MQNSIKYDVTGPTKSFLDPVERFSWWSLNAPAKNRAPVKNESIGCWRKLGIACILLTALMTSVNCFADNLTASEPYGFARVGAGVALYKHGGKYDGLAAHFDVGVAWPLNDHLVLDARIGHGSFWFEPDDSDWVNYGNIGLEIRW